MSNEERLEYLDARVKSLTYALEEAQEQISKYEDVLRAYNRLLYPNND